MTSETKRALACRENARKSTGPRTPKGKSRASRNAIRHGLRSVTFARGGSSERVTAIANKLCENDPFPYRYEVALEIAEAQVFLDRIKLARASMMEKLQAAIAPMKQDSTADGTEHPPKEADQKKSDKRIGVTLTNEEFADLNRSMAEGDVRRAIQYLRLSTKRSKELLKAVRHGEPAVHEFLAKRALLTVRPRPKPKPQPDIISKLTAELGSLERYERSALARKRRAIRRFDALRDD